MAVDYDVVIIGGTPAGRYAAVAAAQLRATVALVEPFSGSEGESGVEGEQDLGTRATGVGTRGHSPLATHHSPLITRLSPLTSYLLPHTLTQLGQLTQQLASASQFGILHSPDPAKNCQISLCLTEAFQYAIHAIANLEDQNSPAVLAALGVDFIPGNGKFEPQPRLTFAVNNRRLLARTYLLATNSRPAIPEIEGLQMAGYLTPGEIWQSLTSQNPPQRWVILGSDPTGCQMAQTLAQLGLDVTLIVKRSHILPKEDPEIAQLVQATLEAEGVKVFTSTSVTQVKRINDKKWIQAGNEAMEFDEILLCAGLKPNFENLNLEAVGVKLKRDRLLLNEKLQTTNHRIYACGDTIGGYQFANIANYEASTALKNALFFPGFKVDYRSIPWVVFTQPQLARVGLTEMQARRIYNRDVVVLRQNFQSVAAAQIQDQITGVCKLIVRRNGEILGAAVVGSQAGEIINSIALAIATKLKVDTLALISPIYPSFSEILHQIAIEYHKSRLERNPTLQNLLEGFFSWRRSH